MGRTDGNDARRIRRILRKMARGLRMMSWNSKICRFAVVTTTILLLGTSLAAQAPEGPQNASPPQANPAAPAPKPAAPQQKPQEGGVTISVEVPVVTLDVVARLPTAALLPV